MKQKKKNASSPLKEAMDEDQKLMKAKKKNTKNIEA